MKNAAQPPMRPSGERPSGPQGTRVFSVTELRRHAADADGPDRASVDRPVLEGLSAGIEGRRYSLRPGRQTIGRRIDSDILVDDPSVSASHAWIMNQQGHHVIMNTLSTNGTFVNDRRVHEATLRHRDRIRLGQAELVFLTREHDAAGPARLRWFALGLLLLGALAVLVWWLVW